MTDFLKLFNPFSYLSFLYEQFTPVHHYEFKNRNVDYFSEEEHGEIEVEIKKSLFIRFYALKVPYGCVISSDRNLMFSRKFDIKTGEDYVLIPHDQIPKQLQISKLKLRYSYKSSKKNILEMLLIEDKENLHNMPEYESSGSISITNNSDYEIFNLIVTKKIEVPSNIELKDIKFKILPEPPYDQRIIDGGLVGKFNRNSQNVEKIKRILGIEWPLDIKPHTKETFDIYYKYSN
jgi:hypothetical protein